jgi:hypothetical protein
MTISDAPLSGRLRSPTRRDFIRGIAAAYGRDQYGGKPADPEYEPKAFKKYGWARTRPPRRGRPRS